MAHDCDPVSIYVELSAAIYQLEARGLQLQVKWAAEQLVGLPEHAYEQGAQKAAQYRVQQFQIEHPKLILGRSLFQLKVGTALLKPLQSVWLLISVPVGI